MVGKADYEPVLESEGGSSGQGAESACQLSSHVGLIID